MMRDTEPASQKSWFQMDFSGAKEPQLVGTSFLHPRLHDARGNRLKKPLSTQAPELKWTKGPQALALFIVKATHWGLHEHGDSEGARFVGKPEKTLYDALRKTALLKDEHWAVEIFGYTGSGMPFIENVIEVFETGKLRGAELQKQTLNTSDIQIRWDDRDVSRDMSQLESLINAMNIAYFSATAAPASILPVSHASDSDTPETGHELTISGSGGVATVTGVGIITIILNCDIDSFTQDIQARIVRAAAELGNVTGKIPVIKSTGSVRLTLALTPEQAERLMWAVKAGSLAEFGVVEAWSEQPGAERCPVAVALLRSGLPVDDVTVEETEMAVILSGSIATEDQKQQAAQAVRTTLGGREFRNKIEVLSGEPRIKSKSRSAELQMILRLHALWLLGEHDGVRANLNGAELQGVNLREVNLSDADLSNAEFTGANLNGAKLTDAIASKANFSGADLRDSDLRRAYLRRARFRGTDLRGAVMYGADLFSADLTESDLSGTNLSNADMRRVDLRGAKLAGTNLTGANLEGALLPEN